VGSSTALTHEGEEKEWKEKQKCQNTSSAQNNMFLLISIYVLYFPTYHNITNKNKKNDDGENKKKKGMLSLKTI